MKKTLILLLIPFIISAGLFAQSDDELFGGSSFDSDDALFGGDDDFFTDDGIDVVENVSASSDLSKGLLFENGTVKVGGSFSTSISTTTTVYADDNNNFGEHIKDSTLSPQLSAYLSVDARPSENLRMYTKFGMAYPFALKELQ